LREKGKKNMISLLLQKRANNVRLGVALLYSVRISVGTASLRIISNSPVIKVKVTLRLTVSQSVCLDVEPLLVLMTE
jgi:hypothetical protein